MKRFEAPTEPTGETSQTLMRNGGGAWQTGSGAFTAELSAIGRNINQIAKRINAGGSPYQADMEEIREEAPLSRYLFCLKSWLFF